MASEHKGGVRRGLRVGRDRWAPRLDAAGPASIPKASAARNAQSADLSAKALAETPEPKLQRRRAAPLYLKSQFYDPYIAQTGWVQVRGDSPASDIASAALRRYAFSPSP